jgi:hypothetical protein
MDIDYQRLTQSIMLGIADGMRLAREDQAKVPSGELTEREKMLIQTAKYEVYSSLEDELNDLIQLHRGDELDGLTALDMLSSACVRLWAAISDENEFRPDENEPGILKQRRDDYE